MLTSDLLRVKIKGKTVEPAYVDPTHKKHLARAGTVVSLVLEAAEGEWSYGRLTDALTQAEGTDTGHKLLRGLAKVMLDGCTFEARCPLEPAELRQRVFGRAAATGPLYLQKGPLDRRTAHDVLAEVAAELPHHPTTHGPWTAEQVQDALYADLKRNQVLVSRKGPTTAEALLHRYNVALVQAVLLKASSVTVRMARPDPKRLRQLLRRLKFHQLMVRTEATAGDLRLTVDGPQSLLRQSSRYGLQLAIFFPAVLQLAAGWTLEAQVLWGKARKLKKTLTVHHTRGLKSHYRDVGTWRSQAEERFVPRFEKAGTGWEISQGELLQLGGQQLLVPDLTFRREGRVAHLDIVGFWRRGYLEKRLEDTPPHVILAVSKRLVSDKSAIPASLAERVVPFAEIIPAKKVLAALERVAVAE